MHGALLHDPHPRIHGLHVPHPQRHLQRGENNIVLQSNDGFPSRRNTGAVGVCTMFPFRVRGIGYSCTRLGESDWNINTRPACANTMAIISHNYRLSERRALLLHSVGLNFNLHLTARQGRALRVWSGLLTMQDFWLKRFITQCKTGKYSSAGFTEM